MYNGPSSTTHDPVMKRREYGRAEGERAGGGQDVQAFCLLGGKVKRGRCMLIEFSAGGGRDASTKSPQTDQDGRQSPQKKCTLIITTFFRTKRLVFSSPRMATCPRGDPLYRPPASLSHFRPPSLTCSTVSPFTIELFLFALCRHIFCRRFRICLRRGYLKTCHPRTGILVAHFRETGSGGRVIHVGGRSATSGCRGLPGKSWPRFRCRQWTRGTVENDELKSDCQTCSKPVWWFTVESETLDWAREGRGESQPLMDYD